MIGAIIFTVLAVLLWAVYAYKSCVNWRLSSSLPPEAPGSRPFVGHYFGFGGRGLEVPVKRLARLAEEHGSPFTVRMGFRSLVIVSDFRAAVAACRGGGFHGKPLTMANIVRRGSGIVNARDEAWAANRKFCLRTLKEAGFGCRATEEMCLTEAAEYVDKLKERCGKPYDVQHDLRLSIANVVGGVLIGNAYKKKNLAAELPDLAKVLAPFGQSDPRSVAPELRLMNMLAATTALPKLIVGHSRFKRYLRKLVNEAQESALASKRAPAAEADPESAADCGGGLIGAYLVEEQRLRRHQACLSGGRRICRGRATSGLGRLCRRRATAPAPPEVSMETGTTTTTAAAASEDPLSDVEAQNAVKDLMGHLITGKDHVQDVASDLLVSGVDTLTSAMSWVLYVLCRHEDVQRRMFKEIRAAVGTSRLPRYEDRHALPYTRAVLCEVTRMYPAIPATIACSRDPSGKKTEQLETYEIPRGTPVYLNLWAALRDPHQWSTPNDFSPDRFLDAAGNFRQPSQPYCPFGVGQRTCIGEPLALQLVFIFTAAVVQTFRVSFSRVGADNDGPTGIGAPEADPPPSDPHRNRGGRDQHPYEEGHLGLSYAPNPFDVLLLRRGAADEAEVPSTREERDDVSS